jgi:hypothetical protein
MVNGLAGADDWWLLDVRLVTADLGNLPLPIGEETKAPCSAFLYRCPIIAHMLAGRGPERGGYVGCARL